jgi:hypothetical protein
VAIVTKLSAHVSMPLLKEHEKGSVGDLSAANAEFTEKDETRMSAASAAIVNIFL